MPFGKCGCARTALTPPNLSRMARPNRSRPIRKGRDDLVWPSPRGGYISGPSLWKTSWLATAVKRCQAVDPSFPRITPHGLRHTAASLAIHAGANPKGNPADALARLSGDDFGRLRRSV
jgi:integrase